MGKLGWLEMEEWHRFTGEKEWNTGLFGKCHDSLLVRSVF